MASLRSRAPWLLVVAIACGSGQPPAVSEGPVRDPDRSLRHYGQAVKRLEAGDPVGAKADLEAAVAADPGNHAAHFQLGVLAARAGQWAEAEASLAESVRLVPADAVYSFHHGRALYELGRHRQAEEVLRRSLAAAPGQFEAHFFLGLVLEALGNYHEAAVQWSEAARLDGCFTPALVRLGELYERWGFYEESLVVADEGLRCDRPSAPVWRLWALCGRVNERGRNVAAALRCYDEALQMRAEPDLLRRRGLVLEGLGRYDEARRDLEAYLRAPESSWNAERVRDKLELMKRAQARPR